MGILFIFIAVVLVLGGLWLVWQLFQTSNMTNGGCIVVGFSLIGITVCLMFVLPFTYGKWEYYFPSVGEASMKATLLKRYGINNSQCSFNLRSADEIKTFTLEKSTKVEDRLEQVFFARFESEQPIDTSKRRWEGRFRAIYQHDYGWNLQDMQFIECKNQWTE
jgi:hypothetical protein